MWQGIEVYVMPRTKKHEPCITDHIWYSILKGVKSRAETTANSLVMKNFLSLTVFLVTDEEVDKGKNIFVMDICFKASSLFNVVFILRR
jgi:hypothetical protein